MYSTMEYPDLHKNDSIYCSSREAVDFWFDATVW